MDQIRWIHQEEGVCEGVFKSRFFHDEDGNDELNIAVKSPDLMECAEKCVEGLNSLTESQISEICRGIIDCAREIDEDGEIELPDAAHGTDILEQCWFTMLYVNMLHREDEVSYVLEGEGDWGDVIGVVVNNGKVAYVGVDYFEYMRDE